MAATMERPGATLTWLDARADALEAGEIDRKRRLHLVMAAILTLRVLKDPSIESDDPTTRLRIAKREGIIWNRKHRELLDLYIEGETWDEIGAPAFKMVFEWGAEPWWDLETGNPIVLDDGSVRNETLRDQVIAFLSPSNWG